MTRLPPLLRLLRPALAPTAAADVLAGAFLAGEPVLARVVPAAAASVCLYAGGMALNDLVDRERDAELHPSRPLVQDPGLVKWARALAAGLFVLGLVLGHVAGLLGHAAAVALLAAAYDLGLKRIFPFDALALGGARAANLALGLAAGGYGAFGPAFAYVLAYLVFTGAVTAASRSEDQEVPTRRLTLLLSFLAQLLAYALLALVLPASWGRGLVFLVPAGLQALALFEAISAGTRPAAERYVFRSLLLLYLVHGGALWAVGRPGGLALVFGCAAATFFLLGLRRKVPAEDGGE